MTSVNQRLDEMGAPRDRQRAFIMNPAMNAAAVQGFAGLFNGADKISKQFGSGVMVDSLGLSYAMDQNVSVHTNGTQPVGTGTVNDHRHRHHVRWRVLGEPAVSPEHRPARTVRYHR
jgi:hypothetical protein